MGVQTKFHFNAIRLSAFIVFLLFLLSLIIPADTPNPDTKYTELTKDFKARCPQVLPLLQKALRNDGVINERNYRYLKNVCDQVEKRQGTKEYSF